MKRFRTWFDRRRPSGPKKEPAHPTVACRAVLKRLRALGVNLPTDDENYRISRTYAGSNQRSEGAWSWSLKYTGKGLYSSDSIGGYWTATLCAREGATLHHSDATGWTSLEPSDEAIKKAAGQIQGRYLR